MRRIASAKGRFTGSGVAVHPHDGEGSKRETQLSGSHRNGCIGKQRFEPALGGQRTGGRAAFGGVKRLKDNRIDRRDQTSIAPEPTVGLGDKTACDAGRQRRAQRPHRGAQSRKLSGIDLLRINADPGIGAAGYLRRQRRDDARPGVGVVERRGTCLVLREQWQERHKFKRHPRRRARQVAQGGVRSPFAQPRDALGRGVDRQPFRKYTAEPAAVAGQRRKRPIRPSAKIGRARDEVGVGQRVRGADRFAGAYRSHGHRIELRHAIARECTPSDQVQLFALRQDIDVVDANGDRRQPGQTEHPGEDCDDPERPRAAMQGIEEDGMALVRSLPRCAPDFPSRHFRPRCPQARSFDRCAPRPSLL